MKEMFNIKEMKCVLKDSNIIIEPNFENAAYDKNTFKYYGSHI